MKEVYPPLCDSIINDQFSSTYSPILQFLCLEIGSRIIEILKIRRFRYMGTMPKREFTWNI